MRIVVLLIFLHVVDGSNIDGGDFNLTWSALTSRANSAVRSIVKSALPSMFRIISEANVSNACERGLMSYMVSLQRSKIWALEMIDATAKIPSGLLRGMTMDFGEFDECLKIRVPEISKTSGRDEEMFRGRYCTIGLQSDLLLSAARIHDVPNHTNSYGEPPELVKFYVNKLKSKIKNVWFFFGVCIPSLCSQVDLQRISSAVSKPLGVNATVVDCQIDEPYVWPVHSVVALSALAVLASICAVGTTLDVRKRNRKTECTEKEADFNTSNTHDHTLFRFLEAFSVLANSEKVLHSDKENASLSCFHGIRFLSATWIVFGHCYTFTNVWMFYTNRDGLNRLEFFNNVSTGPIESFVLAVDTFFFISGFLLVYSTWRQIKKNEGKLDLIKFFISKYVRMTPALCFVMTLLMIMPVIDSGPLWHSSLHPLIENCRVRWWANFLYIGNFISPKLMCLDYTWYLAALMQFHILGVVILLIVYRFRTLGVILGVLLSAICTAILVLQVLWENLGMPTVSGMKDLESAYKWGNNVYIKPHFHFTCYLIGMIVAYILMKYKEKKLCRIQQVIGWCCAAVLALYSVYGIYLNGDSTAFIVFCYIVSRPAWSVVVGWLVYTCCSGSGGFVNRLLSHRIMHPLGKLSYMIYMTHPLITIYRASKQRERTYFGHSDQVFLYFSTLLPSILLAFIGCVTVEIPFQNLHKIIFRRRVNVEKVENKCTEDNPVNMNDRKVNCINIL